MHPIVEFQWIDIENLTEFRACRNSIQGALLIVDERGTESCKNTHIGYHTTEHVTIPIYLIHNKQTTITCTGKLYYLFAPWNTMWYHFYTINPKAHAKMAGIVNKTYLKLNTVHTGIKRSFCFIMIIHSTRQSIKRLLFITCSFSIMLLAWNIHLLQAIIIKTCFLWQLYTQQIVYWKCRKLNWIHPVSVGIPG